jgi:hypothetical protein
MALTRDRVVLPADVTNSTTSFADATSLSFPLTAGLKYMLRGGLVFTGTATTGVAVGLNASPSTAPTLMAVNTTGALTATTDNLSAFTAFDTGTAGSDLIAAGSLVELFGFIVPSVTAIYIVRFKAETAVATVMKAGSTIWYEQVQ